MTEPMKIRTEHECVIESDIIKIKDLETFDVDVMVSMLDSLMTRKMAKCTINDTKFFVDVMTGTLYNPKTGKCNSPHVWITKVHKKVKNENHNSRKPAQDSGQHKQEGEGTRADSKDVQVEHVRA
jgi:hypothetical protein